MSLHDLAPPFFTASVESSGGGGSSPPPEDSVYKTLNETTAKKCLLTPPTTAGESPFPFMGEAQERIHMWSLILLTKHSPHLPAIELEKKKKTG